MAMQTRSMGRVDGVESQVEETAEAITNQVYLPFLPEFNLNLSIFWMFWVLRKQLSRSACSQISHMELSW